jgi:hypothetical protein
MTKFSLKTTALMVVTLCCLMAGTSKAGIVGSDHDFAIAPGNWAGGQTCVPCHTPHGAILKDASGAVLAAPLWNHQLSANTTYVLYLDDSGAGVTGAVDQNSKLCLSCHDGTVALDSFGGNTGTHFIGAGGLVAAGATGNDLSHNHPIGEAAIWPTGASYMVDPSFRDAAHIMPLRKMADGRLAVGCTSCHEPHNRKALPHMLWASVSGSGATVDSVNGSRVVNGSVLCLNCHKK